ncbi:ABC transporter substrate-binding protein [Streptomyces formicae]|uniref:Putative lipoprotein oligopeptide binding protein n=1 Tax=Streptomyces formicae TaxID=1616117 RepID=A0A291Q4Q0_9ACTN|nr:ABC transporter substrate-binding protein [Streptomyces formicae]ATL26476.1 putative lipoprotein oligopeptide binding protein [Streptomyces formicae]
MNRKTLVLPAVIGLLAPALAACGGSGSGDGDDAIAVGTTDAFAISKEVPAPFDPAYAYDAGSWNVLRQTVQTLMALPRGDGEPQPEAAEQCGFTDTGNERYACTLRKGLKFSDGKPLTAADVKFSIERVRDIKLKDPSGSDGLVSNVEEIETEGDREVVFHLKTPDATFPYKLATPTAGIVSKDHYSKNKLRDGFEVSGSGPYTAEQEVKDDRLVKTVFTKNPEYKGQFKPQSDKIELRNFADTAAMGKALKDGDIDLMTRTMSPEQVKQLDASSDKNIDLVEMQGLEIRYLAFNTDAPTVKTKAVRQAMAQLVDRGAIASQVYGSTADPLFSLVPTTITGHANSFFNKYGNASTAKARQLLEKANISTPVKLTLHYTTDHYGPGTKKEFEILRKQLNDSGLFDVDIKGVPWSTFRAAERDGKYAVYGMGWFPDFPDADNFLAPFLDKDNFLGSPYVNRTINDQLIPTSRREADRLAASKSIRKIQDLVAEDVPILPLWQGKQYIAARDDITGVEWALNSASNLQLWELARGVSG